MLLGAWIASLRRASSSASSPRTPTSRSSSPPAPLRPANRLARRVGSLGLWPLASRARGPQFNLGLVTSFSGNQEVQPEPGATFLVATEKFGVGFGQATQEVRPWVTGLSPNRLLINLPVVSLETIAGSEKDKGGHPVSCHPKIQVFLQGFPGSLGQTNVASSTSSHGI